MIYHFSCPCEIEREDVFDVMIYYHGEPDGLQVDEIVCDGKPFELTDDEIEALMPRLTEAAQEQADEIRADYGEWLRDQQNDRMLFA